MKTLSEYLKAGLVSGEATQRLFNEAKAKQYAIPAVNVISTSAINAALEAAYEAKSPIIIQLSYSGAAYFVGKGAPLTGLEASIQGAILAAKYINDAAKLYGIPVVIHTDHASKKLLPWIDGLLEAGKKHFKQTGEPLFSSHMLDLSEESLTDNIDICSKYLQEMKPLDMTIEIELGCTGGEEDGVDNTDIDNAKLYTQPEDVAYAYEQLMRISSNFIIAASFGNVHGVYKSGQVALTPMILKNSQAYVSQKFTLSHHPLLFVFHGGSGSDLGDIKEAISYGTVKMNIDTDTQWAYWDGVKTYSAKHSRYLQSQLGNPKGEELPNKKYYDPRVWLRQSELKMKDRLMQCFSELNCLNRITDA
jgi:fructose-bisphosphate aldolase class II